MLGNGESINAKSLVPAVFLYYSLKDFCIAKRAEKPRQLKGIKTYYNSLFGNAFIQ